MFSCNYYVPCSSLAIPVPLIVTMFPYSYPVPLTATLFLAMLHSEGYLSEEARLLSTYPLKIAGTDATEEFCEYPERFPPDDVQQSERYIYVCTRGHCFPGIIISAIVNLWWEKC